MDTPVQPATAQMAPGVEPGVKSASASAGTAFLADVFAAQQAAPQPPMQQPPMQQPPMQQPPMQQPPMQQPMQQPPMQQPPMQQPPMQQPVAPQPADYTTRYSGNQPPADPLASLQEAPALAPEQQIVPPQNMTDQQNHAWAAMRAQSNANRRAAEEFRAKYNQFVESARKYQEERATFGEQLNAKEKRIQELEDEVGRMDLTRSPAFQEKYDAPIYQVRDDITRTLVDNGKTQEAATELANQILEASRDQLPELISDLPSYVQGIIMVNAQKADGLFNARGQALSEWRQSAEGLAAVQERGSSVLAAQHTDKMASAAIDLIRSMAPSVKPPAYQVVDPTFAAERDSQEQKFRSWVQQAPEEQKYAAMLEGFMAPKTYEMLEQVMRENVQLKQVLAGRARLAAPPVASNPGIMPTLPPAPPKPAPTVQTDGYSAAPGGSMAQQFLSKLFAPPAS